MSSALTMPVEPKSAPRFWNPDRIGVWASVLCAIHCAVTPVLLLILPTFGKIWSHPASHWGMALIVVPIAFLMMTKGFRKHRRKWILLSGSLGIVFVLVGAVLPYLEASEQSGAGESASVAMESDAAGEGEEAVGCSSCSSEEVATTSEAEAGCVDNCCPSIQVNEQGEKTLHIPPASIVTTAGGLFLIATHIGNLCCCPSCRRKSKKAVA